MSGLGVLVTLENVRDDASPAVAELLAVIRSKAGLHEAVGQRARELTRNHLKNLNRHKTADRLGATPSGHWSQAAEKTTMKSTEESAVVSVKHPGIGRAEHDVEIFPSDGIYLTIPLIAQAYNRRARRVNGLFFAKPKDKTCAVLGKRVGKGKDAKVTWWYLLVTSVFQKMDRTLLPSTAEYRQAAQEGILDYLRALRMGARDSRRGFKDFTSDQGGAA